MNGMADWDAASSLDAAHDTLVIDPVKLGITNRITEDSALDGQLQFRGGLLLQGTLSGQGEIAGRLVIWHTGQLRGHFRVLGDLYLLGHLGGVADDVDEDTVIECQGTAYIASSGVSTGTLLANRLRMYDGAVLQGPFKTLRSDLSVPVLKRR
jgi:cytoskeletal protein CcmA (bactofilin family)